MTGTLKKKGKPARREAKPVARKRGEWASGLKQLYDSVVEEPIPDTFRDLLARLDDDKK